MLEFDYKVSNYILKMLRIARKIAIFIRFCHISLHFKGCPWGLKQLLKGGY